MPTEQLYIDSDNLIKLTGLRDQSTSAYVNSAVVTMSLYKTFPVYNEKQSVKLLNAVSGTFVLELDEYITADIAFDASASEIATAMVAANANLSAGDFIPDSVNRDLDSAQAGNEIRFQFAANQAAKNQTSMLIDTSNCLPSSAAGTITVNQEGYGDVLDNADAITLDYQAASNGNYEGIIPDNVSLVEDTTYYLVVTATSGSSTLKSVKAWPAVYHGKQRTF